MEMERQNKKMQVWNLLAEKIRKLVEESVSNPEELQEILLMGCRVPDHGKFVPWRLVLISGDSGEEIVRCQARSGESILA